MPPSRLITLTTDFGLADHYVGTLKGVILSKCPGATIIDISHEVPEFSIYSGAYTIAQAASYFPAGTVHVVVVDPGVGTARRPVLVEAADQVFIAPDNGVLSMVVGQRTFLAREINNRALWLKNASATFHGRDIFAPVAAAIAGDQALPEDVGPVIQDLEMLPDLEPTMIQSGVWRGRILSIDRFGNIITNFRANDFPMPPGFEIQIGDDIISEFHKTFGEAPEGVCFAYAGSSGFVEIAINQGSAAGHLDRLDVRLGGRLGGGRLGSDGDNIRDGIVLICRP